MKAATYSQANRPLQLTMPLGPDALYLVGFEGREGLSRLYRFHLDLLAENGRDIAFDKLLGQPIAIGLAAGMGPSRFVHGIVSRFSQGMRDDTFTHYRAEVVPQLWLLTQRVQCRIFQHQSVPAILKEVFKGLSVRFELQGTFHPRNYCVQYRESEFAFASRLMEEEGFFYFFEHAADGHVMVVANTRDSHPELPEALKGLFAPGGRIELHSCKFADPTCQISLTGNVRCSDWLRQLADAVGADVVAAEQIQYAEGKWAWEGPTVTYSPTVNAESDMPPGAR